MQEQNLQRSGNRKCFSNGEGSLVSAVMIGAVLFLMAATTLATPDPTYMFEGLRQFTTDDSPPDTNGAVSRDVVVTPLNNAILIQRRDGSTVHLPVTMTEFWSGVALTSSLSDPVVVFDPYTNRWFLTELEYNLSGPGGILIAASKSPDPDPSNWWKWRLSTGTNPDQPKIGFNSKWVAVQVMFSTRSMAITQRSTYSTKSP